MGVNGFPALFEVVKRGVDLIEVGKVDFGKTGADDDALDLAIGGGMADSAADIVHAGPHKREGTLVAQLVVICHVPTGVQDQPTVLAYLVCLRTQPDHEANEESQHKDEQYSPASDQNDRSGFHIKNSLHKIGGKLFERLQKLMAETLGFEPRIRVLHVYTISNRAPSANSDTSPRHGLNYVFQSSYSVK